MSTNREASDRVGRDLRAALASALDVRLHGPHDDGTDDALRRACAALAAHAVARGWDPEQLVHAFREVWDRRFVRRYDREPRSLLYYGTLSQCLDAYEECARTKFPSRGAPSSTPASH